MKILNVQLKHIHGGNPQACLNYTQLLRTAGSEVSVLLNPAEPFIDRHKALGAEVLLSKKLGELGSYDIFTIYYFKKVIAHVRPDVIITHEGRSSVLMKRAVGKNIPIVDVNHGRGARQSRMTYATIVTNSSQLKSSCAVLDKNHMVYKFPNSIDLSSHVAPEFPKAWNALPVIGSIGRLVSDKGLDVFIDALNLLNERGVKFKAIIAGEGEERKMLERKISEFNLGEFVSLPGWIKNPDEFYKTIDIFCFPSRKEEFGLVLLEAWKNGLPAIVSDADGPADISTAGVDALIVEKENPTELANALSELLNDKAQADKLAINGYKKLKKKYDIQVLAGRLQAILEEVTGKCSKKIRKNQGK